MNSDLKSLRERFEQVSASDQVEVKALRTDLQNGRDQYGYRTIGWLEVDNMLNELNTKAARYASRSIAGQASLTIDEIEAWLKSMRRHMVGRWAR